MKFSIVTPTYNRAYCLERAIMSVLAQTYKDYELIISDDGSTDETKYILNKYRSNQNIKIVENTNNNGVNVARNKAMLNISHNSDYTTFLDSDDELLPTALEDMKKTIVTNSGYKYFRFGTMYDGSESRNYLKEDGLVANYEMQLSDSYAKGDWIVALNSNLIREGFRFEEAINGFEGIAWLRLSKKELVKYDNKVVLKIHANVNDSLLRPATKSKEYYLNLKAGIEMFLNEFEADLRVVSEKRLAQRLYALGDIYYKLGMVGEGDSMTKKAFFIDPLNLRLIRNIMSKLSN